MLNITASAYNLLCGGDFLRIRHAAKRFSGFGRHFEAGIIFKLVCVMAVCAAAVLLLDARFRPAINTVAQTRAENLAVSTVNECVNELLSRDDVSYEALVEITTDSDGKITSVRTNAAKINRLKSELALMIDSRISENSKGKITIPFGSVSGIDLLSGMGPDISVSVHMTGSTQADFTNSFISAGINQTQHRIMLSVTTKVYIFLCGNENVSQLKSEYCVAETIIVGEVPQVMAQITSPQEIPQK